MATYILNWSSPIVNPAIYVITQERYRQAFEYLFRGFVTKKGGFANGPNSSYVMNRRRGSNLRSSVSEG